MNRIVTMVLKNLWIVPGAWFKLCRYAKHTDEYPEEEKYRHIQYILQRAVRGGNVDMTVTGQENIPTEGGFMLYANHQGMFDVLAIAATCHRPIGAVLKKELYDIPFLHQIVLCTKSFAMDRETAAALPYCKNPPVYTGNPLRSAFSTVSRASARRALHLNEQDLLLLSFTGASGSFLPQASRRRWLRHTGPSP